MLVPMERSSHKEYIYEICKLYLFWLGSYGQGLSVFKVDHTSRSRSLGQNVGTHGKILSQGIHM